MKFSKIIFFIEILMFLTITLSHANKVVTKSLAKQQQLNPGLDTQVKTPLSNNNTLHYTIIKLPINGTLYYDDVQVTESGFEVEDSNKLTIDPKDGDVTVVFEYTSTQEGVVSEKKAVIMPFTGLKIFGSVFHDHKAKKISKLNGKAIYILLLDHEGKILTLKAVNKRGKFGFNNSDGLCPDSDYALIISTDKSIFRSIHPTKWSHFREDMNTLDVHKDDLQDGMVLVQLKDKDIKGLHLTASNSKSSVVTKPIAMSQQLNPGLDVQIKVVSVNMKNDFTSYNIVKLPVNGTLYYDGVQITEYGFEVEDPNKLTLDPEDGNVTVVFKYISTQEGVVSEKNTVIMPFTGLEISGSVFHDYDGNGIVDGEKIFALDGETLYVSLVDHNEKILASKAVNENGRFRFGNSDGIQPYNNYTLIISTEKSVFRSVLPSKWSYSGESIDSLDDHKDGMVVVQVRDQDISKINFGLDIRPLAKEITQLIQLNPGGETEVTVAKLDGNDSENGDNVRYMITAWPDNAMLYNNGKKITQNNVEIKDPESVTVDPDNGDEVVQFEYVTVDAADVVSYPATVTLPFAGLSISGKLFNDGDGDARVNGKPISHIGDVPMYATLLNENKITVASASIAENGTYEFEGTNYVAPHSTFYVVVSTEQPTITSTLPSDWNNSGEGKMNDAEAENDGNNDGIVEVEVGIKDVRDINFGVNHQPVADNITVQNQLNPGGFLQVSVPTLHGNDDESGKKLIYTISSLPKNATLYYADKKIVKEGFIVTGSGKFMIDPENGEKDTVFSYTVTDEADIASDPATVSMTFKELKLSGHILNDGDGDGDVNGEAIIDAQKLYVLLLARDQTVLASKAIEKDGTYLFDGEDGVNPDTKFFIILAKSPNKNDFGLPKGWNNTGENINDPAEGKDKSPDGVIAVNIAKTDVDNIDFGINQKPTAQSQVIKGQLNPGLDIQVPVPTLTGNDRESRTKLLYKIESLPTLGILYYNGIKVEKSNFIIAQKDKLSIDPDNGDKVVSFTFTVTDQTGVVSDSARVEIGFKGLSLSGHLFHDGNGNTKVKGKAFYNPSNIPLYVTLLNEDTSVLTSKILNKDGTYIFNGEDGVRANMNYQIVLSTRANSKVSLLPNEWVNSSEAINSKDDSKDMLADGIVNVHMLENDIADIDFCIDKRPIADNKVTELQISPGGSQTVQVPQLSGNDEEDGTKLRYMIKVLPDNAILYNKKVKVLNYDFVDPDSLTLDPKDGNQTVIFTYVSIDQAGNPSHPATVTMSFIGLSISGRIFEDFIINGNVDGSDTIAVDNLKFYMTLLDAQGEIVATVPTLKDGSYLFNQTNGVNAHTNYTLVLSKDQNATTSILIEGWNHADGENVNSLGKGNDGKADGMIDVSVKDNDLKEVDFGINYLFQ